MAAGEVHDRHLRYLLDELPEADRDALEEEYFSSDVHYGDLLAAEDDLIEKYLEGALPPDRRQRFEERYLATDEGRRRIDFERSLRQHASGRTNAGSGFAGRAPVWRKWAAGLAAAAVVALGVAGFQLRGQFRDIARERDSLLRSAREHEQRTLDQERRVGELQREVERLRPQASALEDILGPQGGRFNVAALALASSGRRAQGALPRLMLSRDVSLVRLTLAVDGNVTSTVRASLQTVEGRELWTRSGLRAVPAATGTQVVFMVPAAVLSPGHYVVAVTDEAAGPDASSIADFVFQVAAAR